MTRLRESKLLRRSGLLAAVFLLLGISACDDGLIIDGEDVDGSGTIVVESRDVSGFDQVTLAGEGTIILVEGEDESVTIETDDNLLAHIETRVSGGTLTIATERGVDIDPSAYVIYRVAAPEINGLTLTGAGSIELDEVEADTFSIVLSGAGGIEIDRLVADNLEVRISGVGSVDVAGTVTSQDVVLSGTGDYSGRDLESVTATVVTSGVGSATVWVTADLDATVSGVGSIDYYGSPQVTRSVTGLGDVNARGDA